MRAATFHSDEFMKRGLAMGIRVRDTRVLIVAAFVTLSSLAAAQDEQKNAAADAPAVDVDIAGEIVVFGRRNRDIQQAANQVLSVLSAEDIARTGEGDIAGALGRVTGLSVASNGFVYVRGLGDRYSQALLNGSPLPSPEPLRRAVPLDIFPTDVIASSLVQKSYSPNFTGEFGGGMINLTTLAVPKESFLKFGTGVSGDSETTGQLGYDHYGSKFDYTGRDNGVRDVPPALAAFFASGERISSGKVDTGAIARELVNNRVGIVQQIDKTQANGSGNITGGLARDVTNGRLGLIATVGYGNSWRTKENTEQSAANASLSIIDKDYRRVSSENRIQVNALVGVGFESDAGNKLRWTNLIVRDTLKRSALAEGRQNSQRPGADFIEQDTGWYERQVWSTQLSGNLDLEPFKLDGRIAFANSSRKAPFELGLGYSRSNAATNPYGAYFINRLDNGQTGYARAVFSELDEDLLSYGFDVSRTVTPSVVISAGYEGSKTDRTSERREFQAIAPSDFPSGVAMFRPDFLLGAAVIKAFNIRLVETTETDPAFVAALRTNAGYLQLQAEVTDTIDVNIGARYEKAQQTVQPLKVFTTAVTSGAGTNLDKGYLLPAATITYKLGEQQQLRANVSRTIARPQFRELMFQAYYDPESNRAFRGNPLLQDTELTNAEVRYERYLARDERVSAALFWKKLDRPIEAFTGFNDNSPITSFANAPSAQVYGLELDGQKYFDLDGVSKATFFATRRAVVIGNYTWSKSSISVKAGDQTSVFGTAVQPASNFFQDGVPLAGQAKHLANLQLGLEDSASLSQQTLLINYSSDRVTSRGAAGLPDILESPGVTIDFVARQGVTLFGRDLELKFEARNLLQRDYREFQERAGNKVYFNRYDVGVKWSASFSTSF